MKVYGDLIAFGPDRQELPLPWHCRAPLGHKSKTPMYVALVQPRNPKRLPDVVATVLPPKRWETTWSVHLRHQDRSGLLDEALQALEHARRDVPINIALGETSTLMVGSVWPEYERFTDRTHEAPDEQVHDICLFLEIDILADQPSRQRAVDVIDRFRQSLGKEWTFVATPFAFPGSKFDSLTTGPVTVKHGKLRLSSPIDTAIIGRYADAKTIEQFDLTKAVASADLDARVLRFVFPRLNAVRIETMHEDQPGVLRTITRAISDANYSILGSHLRRGGDAGSESATFVAVCEPEDNARLEELDKRIRAFADGGPPSVERHAVIGRAKPADTCLFHELHVEELCRQLQSITEDRFARIKPRDRQEILEQALRLNSLPLLDPKVMTALESSRNRIAATRTLYLSTGANPGSRDQLDDLIRELVRDHIDSGGRDGRTRRPRDPRVLKLEDGDLLTHDQVALPSAGLPLATRMSSMFASGIGVFVVRLRRTDGDRIVDFQPLQELAIFHTLGSNKRSLLLVDDRATPGMVRVCADWGSAVDVRMFRVNDEDANSRTSIFEQRHPLAILELWLSRL